MGSAHPDRPTTPAPVGPAAGRLVRSVLTLMTGTLVAQAISFGITPVLSRLYAPEDFGVLGLLNAFSMVFVGGAALRFDMAVVVPKHDAEAVNVLLLALVATGGTTLLTLAMVGALGTPIAAFLGAPGLEAWLWVAPLVVLTSGTTSALNHWCMRRKQFRRMSIASVLSAGASAGGKAGAGSLGWGAPGLIAGQIGGQVIATLVLAFQVLAEDLQTLRAAADRASMRRAAREHADFPRYQAPMTLLNGLAQNLPVYFLGVFFGARQVGYWSLTVLVLSMPVFLVANAVRQVLFQRTSELYNERGDLGRLLRRSTWALALLAIVPTILASVFGPTAFALLLGEEWEPAGELARWAMIWQATVLVSTPATAAFPVLHLQRLVFVWQIGGMVLATGALAAGGLLGSPEHAVLLYSVTMAALNLLLVAMVARYASMNPRTEPRNAGEDDRTASDG